MRDLMDLEPFDGDKSGDADDPIVNVVIETPKGSRNKFAWDEKRKLFMLKGVLPIGATWPFDFGFIPGTRGEDGDPLDVLVLMDEPAFAGCVVPCRLIGAIEAKQTERDGKTAQNDRLIAVASKSRERKDVRRLSDLPKSVIEELEYFFVSFNHVKGKRFAVKGRAGPRKALKLVRAGMLSHRRRSK